MPSKKQSVVTQQPQPTAATPAQGSTTTINTTTVQTTSIPSTLHSEL